MAQAFRTIRDFDDFQIKPAMDWNAEIIQKLAKADLVICLISSAFVGSRYCTINEMSDAIDRKTPILSVILREVDFEALPVSRFQALPVDANGRLRPLSKWRGRNGRDEAWARVAQSIRIAMSQIATRSTESEIEADRSEYVASENDQKPDELEHIRWTVDNRYKRIEEFFGVIPFGYYIHEWVISIPTLKIEIERAILDLKEYALREQRERGAVSFFVYGAFEAMLCGDRFISLRSYFRLYFGGAHSNFEYRAITFDLLTRKCISLGDLLRTRSQHEAVVELVGTRVVAERQRRSSEPIDGSVQAWLPCRPEDLCFCLVGRSDQRHMLQGIKIMFAPYEIGSFAEGPYELDIPATSLVELGKPLFREICNLPPVSIDGRYTRLSKIAPAFIRITKANGKNMVHVEGEAYWGEGRFYGPNTGQLNFVAEFDGRQIEYQEKVGDKDYCCQIIVFNSSIDVDETYGMQGHNVNFSGRYSREQVDDENEGEEEPEGKLDPQGNWRESLRRVVKGIFSD